MAWTNSRIFRSYVADSFCLCPPLGGLPPEKIMFDIGGLAETFYS